MKFTDKDLQKACQEGLITNEGYATLIDFLQKNNGKSSALETFLYYAGAILIILTMGWFFGLTWASYGKIVRLLISVAAFIGFTLLGEVLWQKGKQTPGGLLFTAAISTVPLLVYSLEQTIGVNGIDSSYSSFHSLISSSWLYMELATLIVGLVFFKYRRFSFLLVPILFCVWYLTMDIAPLLVGITSGPTSETRNFASLFFAAFLLPVGIKYNLSRTPDASFWLLLVGALFLEGSLVSICLDHDVSCLFIHIIAGSLGLIYMFASILLRRNLFMVIGAIDCIDCVGYLAYRVCENSIFFPFSLVAIGLLFIWVGIYYSKHKAEITTKITGLFIRNE